MLKSKYLLKVLLEALTIPTLAAPPTTYACIEMCRTLMDIFKMEHKVKKKVKFNLYENCSIDLSTN